MKQGSRAEPSVSRANRAFELSASVRLAVWLESYRGVERRVGTAHRQAAVEVKDEEKGHWSFNCPSKPDEERRPDCLSSL